jgi:hypothetical protein
MKLFYAENVDKAKQRFQNWWNSQLVQVRIILLAMFYESDQAKFSFSLNNLINR